MFTVLVHVHVKPEFLEVFERATLENARQSRLEPGVERFDVLQQLDDPSQFLLIEVYRNAEAPLRHKETAHYAAWRNAVESVIAEPRTSVRYESL